ncbi:MAG TPA: Cd(II)/Pb(II)-responsive transcriptional regulator [Paucimonas sp.]|nr:Cd(II)/Pb(II)-responsive transcriptional regulator [Paucimonas sp.]
METRLLRIGELAKRTGTPVETVRYYEREGLLPRPARSEGNYRLYDAGHAERLQLIRRCRSLDMTLDEIRSLLGFRDAPEENCEAVNSLLDRHIGHVADRIRELQELERELRALRGLCRSAQARKDCAILQKLEKGDAGVPSNLGSHHGGCH